MANPPAPERGWPAPSVEESLTSHGGPSLQGGATDVAQHDDVPMHRAGGGDALAVQGDAHHQLWQGPKGKDRSLTQIIGQISTLSLSRKEWGKPSEFKSCAGGLKRPAKREV